MFEQIVQLFEAEGDRRSPTDPWGNEKSDTRFLILAALRVLAHSFTFDLCYKMTDITADTHNNLFKVFIKWMATKEYARHLRMPMIEQEIEHVTKNYEHHGVPGCIGSIDAIHIAWDMCPTGLLSNCKGEEGYLTLAFQAIVSHTRKVLGVSGPYYGT
jgi:hypothetical protein